MSTLLHSNILGEGNPLVILHGFLGMSDNWKTMGTKYSEEGFQVHLIDQRNHGHSFWSDEFDYDILAEDLSNYIAGHNLEPAIIIGHSMGGKTAMQFACDYPNKTRKLIVADIAPKYYPPHHQDIINALNTLDFGVIGSRNEADEILSKKIKDIGTRQFLLKNLYWVEKGRLGFRFNLEVLGQRMQEIGENIGSTDNYEGPTLFLRGDRSEYVTDGDREVIKRHFPNSEIETVQNAGHWLHAENPKEFFEKSIKFLKE